MVICVLLKPSMLSGTAVYYRSGEDNHVFPLFLPLSPRFFFPAQHTLETADYVVEILNSARYADGLLRRRLQNAFNVTGTIATLWEKVNLRAAVKQGCVD